MFSVILKSSAFTCTGSPENKKNVTNCIFCMSHNYLLVILLEFDKYVLTAGMTYKMSLMLYNLNSTMLKYKLCSEFKQQKSKYT